MRAGSFLDSLNELNNALYQGIKDFKGFKVLTSYSNNSGILIGLYQYGSDTLFAIKGTDVLTGKVSDRLADLLLSDIPMLFKKAPQQYESAKNFYESIKDQYQNIIFTGYSLGGTIAQMLGNEFGNETYTFEAFPAGELVSPKHTENIYNFGNVYDGIFMYNPANHLGKVLIIPIQPEGKELRHIKHHIYPYGKPSTAKVPDYLLLDNKAYVKRLVSNQTKQAKDYVTKGVIPSVKDRVEQVSKELKKHHN